jgi:hypothetical protein
VTIWANASVGSTFAGFSGSLTGTVTPQVLVMNGNKAVNAAFTLQSGFTLTLTMSGTGSGTIQASPSGPYTYGTVVTIWANASVGSTFSGFSGSLTGTTTPQTLVMNGNKAVNAQFTLNGPYTLALTMSGTGVGTIQASPVGPYYYGASVTIWANASVGSTFSGFSGSLTGTTTPQVLVMNGNKAVDAAFTLNGPYTLGLTMSGSGAGTIQASPAGPYYYGASVTIWANASVGSTFAGFSGSLTGTVTPQVLVMNGNKAVNAAFTLLPQNNPPNMPSGPIPSDDAIGISINTVLSWIGGDPDLGDTVTYDVFFGASNPPSKIVSNQSSTTYNPGILNYNTEYYWNIVSWDTHGSFTVGLVWSFTTASSSNAWWNLDWMYRKEIIINHSLVDADFTNFPVLINLASDVDLAAHTQPSGNDIVFTDMFGNKLNHEIELYEASTGRLVVWVNVTSLSSTIDTVLYMYYGNSLCGSQQNPQGTWNAKYLMVHHMNESGDILDSTSHGLNAVNSGTTSASNGMIDGCRYFDSTADYYNFGTASSLNPGMGSWTISLWTKITHVEPYFQMLRKWDGTAGFTLYLYNGWGGYNYFKVSDGVKTMYRYWDTSWSDGNWHYLTVVINRVTNSLDLYIDGVLHNGKASGTWTLNDLGSITCASNLRLYGGTNGLHDEFCVSTTVLDANWVKTCYNNQNDPASFYILSSQEQGSGSPSWWNTQWMYRKEITIDHTKVATTLENFPVLISLDADADLAAHAQSDGDDIVFTDVSQKKLNHEIEVYVSTTGRLVAWVNVSGLSTTVDTVLFLYYGNSGCGSQQNPQGTWNDEYLMVHHMNESGDILDSTSHGLNAVNVGTVMASNGKIDGCRFFDSTADLYNFGSASSLNPGMGSWTISLWTKITHVEPYFQMLRKWDGTAGFTLYLYNGWGGYNYFKVSDGVKTLYRYWDTSWSDGNWHYITVVINRVTNSLDLYIDGVLRNGKASGTWTLNDLGSITCASNLRLYGGTNGLHDEFCVSTTVRNAGWISTCYTNQNDPAGFYSIGGEESS